MVLNGKNVCMPVLSTPNAKSPFPTCSGVVLLSIKAVRTTLYLDTTLSLCHKSVSHWQDLVTISISPVYAPQNERGQKQSHKNSSKPHLDPGLKPDHSITLLLSLSHPTPPFYKDSTPGQSMPSPLSTCMLDLEPMSPNRRQFPTKSGMITK